MTIFVCLNAFVAAVIIACASCAAAPPLATGHGAIPPVPGLLRDLGSILVIDITEGSGAGYAPRKCVYTHYTGWLADGTKFDASRDARNRGAGEPVGFAQGRKQVIDAWELGFEGMRVGGTRRLIVPWRLGYGARGNPPLIPARSDLVFDVELMGVADTLPHRSGATACPDWSVMRVRG